MPSRHRPVLIAMCLLAGSAATPQVLEGVRFPPPTERAGPIADVERPVHALLEATPSIDGDLSDACWANETTYLGSFRLGLSPTPARHSREAWACYDSENLYLAIKLQRELGTELRTTIKEDDDPQIWEDDEVEIFLDPFGSGTTYYQIILNSLGAVYDAFHSLAIVPDPKGASPTDTMLERSTDDEWSCAAERQIAVRPDSWIIELALPLNSVGLVGAPAGHQVRFNITSADWDTGEYTTLAPVSSWHDPHQFGVALLGERRVDVTSLDLGRVGMGSCAMQVRVADLRGEAARYRVRLSLETAADKAGFERAFSLRPKGRQTVRLGFDTRAVAGAWEASVRIVDAEGRPVYASRRAGTILPPLTVRVKSRAAFVDGADVTVAASIGLGTITARRVVLIAKLLDRRGRVVAEQSLGKPPGADLSARLPVAQLRPGTYRLRLEAVQDDETIASAEDSLRIGASPFAGH